MSAFKYHPGMKKHQVLKQAMKYLAEDDIYSTKEKSEFICNCINKVVNDNFSLREDHSGLVAIIAGRIHPEYTFGSWLENKHGISFAEQDSNQRRKMQYTRLCWMQSMYEEFLAKDE